MLDGCTAWPEADARRYREQGWWTDWTFAELARVPDEDRDRPAVVTRTSTLSYGDLDDRADRFAAGLAERGIKPQDRVLVQLPNVPELAVTLVGCFRLGAVPLLALPSHGSLEIGYLAARAEVSALVIPDKHQRTDFHALARTLRADHPALTVIVVGDPAEFVGFDAVDAEPHAFPAPDPADVALLLLSGGTTGVPKMIPRTHRDYALQIRETARAMGLDADGAYLAALPAAHNAALGCPGVLGALALGAPAVLAATPSPAEVFALIREHGVTLTTLMPSLLPIWAEFAPHYDVDLSGLTIEVGGARLDEATAVAAEQALGCTITRWFGISEGVLSFSRPDDPVEVRLATEGRPLLPVDELRVADDLDRPVPVGQPGELQLRGPYTLRGYYRAEADHAIDFAADGFFRTGDIVRQTPDGNLVVEGRTKDIINRGGEKIPAGELETQVRRHPGVAEAAALALPDPGLGEKICVVVVPAGDTAPPTLGELRRFLTDAGLAGFKLPDRLVVRDTLPQTAAHKVDKRALVADVLG